MVAVQVDCVIANNLSTREDGRLLREGYETENPPKVEESWRCEIPVGNKRHEARASFTPPIESHRAQDLTATWLLGSSLDYIAFMQGQLTVRAKPLKGKRTIEWISDSFRLWLPIMMGMMIWIGKEPAFHSISGAVISMHPSSVNWYSWNVRNYCYWTAKPSFAVSCPLPHSLSIQLHTNGSYNRFFIQWILIQRLMEDSLGDRRRCKGK